MDAWTIYWILQLDSINALFAGLFAIMLCAIVFCIISGAMEKSLSNSYPELESSKSERRRGEALHATAKKLAPYLIITGAICALLPSTKTAAAMVVIPAIANNETIRNEAADLYKLAKEALRDAVTDGEPKRAD